jgi:hypothetical protein
MAFIMLIGCVIPGFIRSNATWDKVTNNPRKRELIFHERQNCNGDIVFIETGR